MCLSLRFAAFAVVAATSVVAEAQEVWRWARNLDEARAAAAQSNKLVLIHFGGKTCKPCQQLEREVFAQPGFGQSLTNDFVGVKVDAYLFPSLARDFKVEMLPTDVICTPELTVVERRISPRSSAEYSSAMAQIAADYHQQQSAAATLYRQPVVSYGGVRPASTQPTAAPQSAPTQSQHVPPAYAANPAPAPQAPQQRDRYADYYEQVGTAQVAPPMHDYAGKQSATPTQVPQDRYADYAAGQQAAPQTPSYSPPAPNYAGVAPSGMASNFNAPNRVAPSNAAPSYNSPDYAAPNRPYVPAAVVAAQTNPAPANVQQGNPSAPRSRPAVTQDQLPPGSAPLSLDGYCPVTLSEQQRWVPGDVRFGAQHEGRTYLFASAAEQQKFLQQPHRYAPVMAGNDPVLATDNGQLLSGNREHGLFVGGQIYLFVSEESLAQFERNRDRYVQNVNRTLR